MAKKKGAQYWNSKLLPCMACRGKAEFRYRWDQPAETMYITVHCTKCGLQLRELDYACWGEDTLVEGWNKREAASDITAQAAEYENQLVEHRNYQKKACLRAEELEEALQKIKGLDVHVIKCASTTQEDESIAFNMIVAEELFAIIKQALKE